MTAGKGAHDRAGPAFDGESAAWLPRLTQLLDEQCGLCLELEALSLKQAAAVAEGDTDTLLRVLGERQDVIERVGLVNELLGRFRARKQEILGRLSAGEREKLSERVGRIGRLVESVQVRDENDRRMLEMQRAGVADELGSLSRGRGALAAYGGARGQPPARLQDRQG